jgi:hypothetical protein
MKKKEAIVITIGVVFLVLLTILFIYLVRKGSAASKIEISSISGKLDTRASSIGNIVVDARIVLSNYSSERIVLNQAKLDVFTVDEENLIGSQSQPLGENLYIEPKANSILNLRFNVNPKNLVDTVSNNTNVTQVINYAFGAKLGKKIKLKGYVIGEGVKVNINEEVEI